MTAIRYRSTRDAEGSGVPFLEALGRGLAPDGGLYIPTSVPTLPTGWKDAERIDDLGALVLSTWLDADIDSGILEPLVRDALSFPVELVPLTGAWDGVHVLELFHGPTLSFKDFGARTMARLMPLAVGEVTILVATSGDTGSAVADGFSGVEGIRVVLLYPGGQVSPIQERQLIVERDGVTALRVEGTFDDCQRMVKAAFADPLLADVPLSSANSINIGRLLPQMLYYLWAVGRLDDTPTVCIPSGNLGNLCGAVLANLSGMDVRRFVAAHNDNRFFPDYLAGGPDVGGDSIRTLSNAMDVGVPSNFERLRAMFGDDGLRSRVDGATVTDEETVASMKRVYDETGYVADPHTAVGLEAVRRIRAGGARHPFVVAATAHPAKFPETVEPALGFAVDAPPRLSDLWERPVAVATIRATSEALRDVILDA